MMPRIRGSHRPCRTWRRRRPSRRRARLRPRRSACTRSLASRRHRSQSTGPRPAPGGQAYNQGDMCCTPPFTHMLAAAPDTRAAPHGASPRAPSSASGWQPASIPGALAGTAGAAPASAHAGARERRGAGPGAEHVVVAHRAQALGLGHLALDELLAAKARVDGHEQHQVHDAQHLLDRAQRRARVEHHARLDAQVLDLRRAGCRVGSAPRARH